MTGCEPTLIRKESGAQFSVGDAGDVWFPPFPLNNSYRDQLDVIKSLQMRDDDVILTGFPKSGSHWFYEILNMLLMGKAEYLPRGKAADMIDANSPDQVEGIRSPRVLNTHVRFRYLPREAIEKKTKIVVLLRNPKDVCVSLYNHMKDWLHGGYTGSWQDFFDIYMDTGCSLVHGNWFDTVLDWEQEMAENQHLPIRLASFEEMFKNPVEQILELSKFLELDRSPDLCSQGAERSVASAS
ncbi:hypothetical protein RRG08_050542 [Elysia crispata]|uniref:Sulfotransferase domain-containing protein n=1 Tax=Elysia crispata TaxID=231223 RepID=A0AAE0ZW32_9GAST|nr:hypothetical protein RRG08_050542 [Elysia crispata]